ncbi:MAG: inositol monophosphatase [Candidatus Roizmanbacteria bacterium]|nr:inositol monophosphatase [Candidatus Roizmanbacteria bacterium]
MLTILEQSARAAGSVVLSYFHKESHITHKTSHQNIVTAADLASQELIKNTIISELAKKGIPESEIGFIGEEQLETKGTKHLFIIDPLDGTSNFASGLDYFCISIAHVENGALTNAVIYWPSRDILYYARAGKGAFKKTRGQEPVQLAIHDELLENSVVFTYLSTQKKYRALAYPMLERLYEVIRGVRINGSLCLDLVHLCDTENATHITINFHGYLWDVAAGALIVKESGGIFADLLGNEIQIDCFDADKQYSFIAAHANVVKALLPYLTPQA